MLLTRLSLGGFKSFVDLAELRIDAGLTGIVGPNGCGKSNLVEALRWAMGETAPRQMRGGGMEDVIFNGTARRPAHNIAEVTLGLDNEARDAPAAFNNAAEIEVTRRIERGGGSTYLINGTEVRARDVQLLFADFSSGAHSSALVGQGRIGDIVSAKPVQRRTLLEEAAGIAGLHARRHEAELKLRAAENNLERLDDVIRALETQLQGLKRQVRQASRYRRLTDRIRETETILLAVRWRAAQILAEDAARRFEEGSGRVVEETRRAAAASARQAEAAGVLPDLRQRDAEETAALSRLRIELERLTEEDRRIEEARRETAARLAQIDADTARETALADEAKAQETRLSDALGQLSQSADGDREAEAAARAEMEAAQNAAADAERELAALTELRARDGAEREALHKDAEAAARRLARATEERATLERSRAALHSEAESDGDLDAVARTEATERTEAARVEEARTALRAAEASRSEAENRERAERDALRDAEAAQTRREAEREALQSLLAPPAEGASALWDRIEVEPGFERALGAALGDDLQASTAEDGPVRWRTMTPAQPHAPLPDGAAPLANVVRAPAALSARLAQIGVVDRADGPRMQAALHCGQRLVSREGALWRWDGFVVSADAPTAASRRFTARNRLQQLADEWAEGARRREAAAEAARDAGEARRKTEAACERLQGVLDARADALAVAREARARAEAEAEAADARRTALSDAAARLDREEADAREAGAEAQKALSRLPQPEAREAALARLREALAACRARYEESTRHHDRLRREAGEREARRTDLTREAERWSARAESAAGQLDELARRRREAEAERAAQDARPAELDAQREALREAIRSREGASRAAALALSDAEQEAQASTDASKKADAALGEAREAAARLEGLAGQTDQSRREAAARIGERLNSTPEDAFALAGLDQEDPLPNADDLDTKLQRLARERENIGAVNLRAETEATELDEQIRTMMGERADLEAAIGRLRQGIANLNREGRARMLAAFETIDGHFRRLFTQLFGGGQAQLQLVDSDDPVEAGLEIMASPPGKRLQSLSLLSGGEKALTALALLFAAFLSNPAPICVLDEADAPLDDSNVERYCDLVTSLARETGTRFILVTHHRITMARVDRLFGVTMTERGVSQLVSVDLGQAERWRESA